MGGKTQQRVAGNVKPSSSGRMRELLTNTQGTRGNIITFSALSDKTTQSKADSTMSAEVSSKVSDKKTPVKSTEKQIEASEKSVESLPPTKAEPDKVQDAPVDNESPTKLSPRSANQKVTLVVKRVGNRDYFQRVCVPQDQADGLKSFDVLGSCSKRIDINAGIGPSQGLNESENDRNLKQSCDSSDKSQENQGTPEEKCPDFDSLLEKLGSLTALSMTNRGKPVDELSGEYFASELAIIDLYKTIIKHYIEEMSILEWDIIVSSIYSWLAVILECPNLAENKELANFSIQVFGFINHLILLARRLSLIDDDEDKFHMRQSLLNDWGDFQSSEAYKKLIKLFFKLAPIEDLNETNLVILEALTQIVMDINPITVLKDPQLTAHLQTEPIFDQEFHLPKSTRYCQIDETRFKPFQALCGLLRSKHRVVLVSAHAMLSKIMEDVCKDLDMSSICVDQDDIDRLTIMPPSCLTSVLTLRDPIMEFLLMDYKVGDISVTIDPNSESYSCALSYLFLWDLILQFIKHVDKELGHRIVHSFKKIGLTQRLLDNIFIMLPPLGERDSLKFQTENSEDEQQEPHAKAWSLIDFLRSPLTTTVKRPVNEIELSALHVYFSVALHLPVTVRKWFNNNSNKRLCNLVNQYTVKHISQVICSLEMETVQRECQRRAHEDKKNNLIIKNRPNAREVYAVYTRDEFRMELTIKLPANYPLGSVQIDGGRRVGVTDVKWRGWLLQLTTFLSHQNGPILDGIDLWRKNIDKRFEGIEKCTICFSILHSNYQLPKKKCITCTKMFHSVCLYKWFETSGNATCPMCRSLW